MNRLQLFPRQSSRTPEPASGTTAEMPYGLTSELMYQPVYEAVDDSRPVPNYAAQYSTAQYNTAQYNTEYAVPYTSQPVYPQAKRARNVHGFFISLNMLLCLVIVWVLIFGINNALHGQPVEDAPLFQSVAEPSVDDATAPAPDAAPDAALDTAPGADSSTHDLSAREALPFDKASVSRE